ncbi:hypothetical protein [Asticcacaulis sp.]|uniref:hypothetical protein n=1 Tax=Asticcacaulis sp. TaxID=1872648 RepID=UPI00260527F1|nr:hypothetical protein [Asticcacaulis sp.]
MSPSIWRLAMAGCVFGAVFVAPAGLAAVDGFAQPIQNLPKINLLQTVTHISNGLGKKDVEPKTISRTDNWRFVMAEATQRPQILEGVARLDRAAEVFPTEYYLNRYQCMTGLRAQGIDEMRENSGNPKEGFNVNDFCLRVLDVSADTELKLSALNGRQPDALLDRPDKGLLRPYMAIVADKKVKPTRENAEMAVNAYLKALDDPKVAAKTTSHMIPLGSGESLVLVPGVAFDAAFTKRVLDYIRNPAAPLPKPTQSLEEVRADAEQAFRNHGITSGEAEIGGYDYGIYYINRGKQVAENAAGDRTAQAAPQNQRIAAGRR